MFAGYVSNGCLAWIIKHGFRGRLDRRLDRCLIVSFRPSVMTGSSVTVRPCLAELIGMPRTPALSSPSGSRLHYNVLFFPIH